jgi:hypothetical protein
MKSKRTPIPNPLEAPEFHTLRMLRRAFSRGGLPPLSMRTPEDEARIAAFFALQQMMYILEEFRKACARHEPVRLVVAEHGQSPNHIVLEIAIVREGKGRP